MLIFSGTCDRNPGEMLSLADHSVRANRDFGFCLLERRNCLRGPKTFAAGRFAAEPFAAGQGKSHPFIGHAAGLMQEKSLPERSLH
jgi:hypothetical protein